MNNNINTTSSELGPLGTYKKGVGLQWSRNRFNQYFFFIFYKFLGSANTSDRLTPAIPQSYLTPPPIVVTGISTHLPAAPRSSYGDTQPLSIAVLSRVYNATGCSSCYAAARECTTPNAPAVL